MFCKYWYCNFSYLEQLLRFLHLDTKIKPTLLLLCAPYTAYEILEIFIHNGDIVFSRFSYLIEILLNMERIINMDILAMTLLTRNVLIKMSFDKRSSSIIIKLSEIPCAYQIITCLLIISIKSNVNKSLNELGKNLMILPSKIAICVI